MPRKVYRRYDPRLKNLVAKSNDISHFYKLGIPKSTLKQWKICGPLDYFSIPELDFSDTKLLQENVLLKSQLSELGAEYLLVKKTLTIFGFQVQFRRLPNSTSKAEILSAIKDAASVVSLKICLEAIGLTAARYRSWLKRQVACLLKDLPSCPRMSPTQLVRSEVEKIRELFTSKNFSHYSVQSLSWLGKKTGHILASPSTWSRVIRQLGLKRNRIRVYPAKPKVGIRASAPGQIWHLDLTILRLQDGSRAFVQCIIDNYSRYILAWKVSTDYGGLRTKELLTAAIIKAGSLGMTNIPNVIVDSGSENLNKNVDELVSSKQIIRTIAQIDIESSNSMIEMLFHRLKHRHLFTIPLTNFEALVKAVDFYFTDSNITIPHSALKGATPEEMSIFFGGHPTLEKIKEINERITMAKLLRIESNTSSRCEPCIA